MPNPPIHDDDSGATYTPWTDGYAVGFKVEHSGGRTEFIYLNPSDGADDGVPNVFLYIGGAGDPNEDEPAHFYALNGED